MKVIILRCDGPGCSTEVQTEAAPLISEIRLAGWLRRVVSDEITSWNEEVCADSRVLHYCPECTGGVQPMLPVSLLVIRQRHEADETRRVAALTALRLADERERERAGS